MQVISMTEKHVKELISWRNTACSSPHSASFYDRFPKLTEEEGGSSMKHIEGTKNKTGQEITSCTARSASGANATLALMKLFLG